ncbi:MAG: bifunctional hydroxymethylpyrimidine kinase/phosphomethylpyrimidine kinase [Gammaproteobacteria bacterium]
MAGLSTGAGAGHGIGRVLIIAGSDSGGGAGIQADIKTVTVLGGYAATAITAVTAQDTVRVHALVPMSPAFVAQQIEVVLDDLGADCIKIGMLWNAPIIAAVAAALQRKATGIPLVLDPILTASDGSALLDPRAGAQLRECLFPRTAVLTPNLPEAEHWTGVRIGDEAAMLDAARALLALGPQAVLLKGGHLPGTAISDVLVAQTGVEVFRRPRIDTRHLHGTGCTLASAVATGLARGLPLRDAVRRAEAFLAQAIACAPGLGRGRGPLGPAAGQRPGISDAASN